MPETCPKCNKTFESGRGLWSHWVKVHRFDSMPERIKELNRKSIKHRKLKTVLQRFKDAVSDVDFTELVDNSMTDKEIGDMYGFNEDTVRSRRYELRLIQRYKKIGEDLIIEAKGALDNILKEKIAVDKKELLKLRMFTDHLINTVLWVFAEFYVVYKFRTAYGRQSHFFICRKHDKRITDFFAPFFCKEWPTEWSYLRLKKRLKSLFTDTEVIETIALEVGAELIKRDKEKEEELKKVERFQGIWTKQFEAHIEVERLSRKEDEENKD